MSGAVAGGYHFTISTEAPLAACAILAAIAALIASFMKTAMHDGWRTDTIMIFDPERGPCLFLATPSAS